MTPQNPPLRQIFEKAKAAEEASRELFRRDAEALARVSRALAAWGRVANFRDNNIPSELTGDALWRRKAELIVALGQVLKNDGLQQRVDDVQQRLCAGEEPLPGEAGPADYETVAIEMLRRALDGDTDAVAKLIQDCVNANPWLACAVDNYFCENLMHEVLSIRRRPAPPPGWEGTYYELVDTLGGLAAWINQQVALLDFTGKGKEDVPSNGRRVRNAYRLVGKLGLSGVPFEPSGPLTRNGEATALRNLLLVLRNAEDEKQRGALLGPRCDDDLCQALKATITRLEHCPDGILFGETWDFQDGLNGAGLNRLAGRTIIECFSESSESPCRLRFHHPDASKPPVEWTVGTKIYDRAGVLAHDRDVGDAARHGSKLADTLECLRAWQQTQGPQPTAAGPAGGAAAPGQGEADAAKDKQAAERNIDSDPGQDEVKPLSPAEKKQALAKLEPAHRKAYIAFEYARRQKEKTNLTVRDAYDVVKEIDFSVGGFGELTDYDLPPFDSWQNYVSKARNAVGDPRNKRRRGRPHGGCIVRSDRIEHQGSNED